MGTPWGVIPPWIDDQAVPRFDPGTRKLDLKDIVEIYVEMSWWAFGMNPNDLLVYQPETSKIELLAIKVSGRVLFGQNDWLEHPLFLFLCGYRDW